MVSKVNSIRGKYFNVPKSAKNIAKTYINNYLYNLIETHEIQSYKFIYIWKS